MSFFFILVRSALNFEKMCEDAADAIVGVAKFIVIGATEFAVVILLWLSEIL